MTKMAAMLLYVKNPSKSLPEPVDRFQSDFTLIIVARQISEKIVHLVKQA